MYESKILKRWKHPESYGGHSPVGDYTIVGQHRDSDALARSNYKRIFEDLVKKAIELGQPVDAYTDNQDDEPKQYVYDFNMGHWAVGWVEEVIIRASAPEALIRYAEGIHEALQDYPVYDEEHFSELEHEESSTYWAGMSVRERYDIIKKHGPEASIFAARRDYIPDNNGGIDDYLRSD